MYVVRLLPAEPPTTPPTYLYYVGFLYIGATNQPDFWVPMVTSETLDAAIYMVSILNGGQPPADLSRWVNVLQPGVTSILVDRRLDEKGTRLRDGAKHE